MTTPGGTTVPVRWTIDLETGAVAQEQFSLPPGSEGTANGLTPDIGSTRGDVVGTISNNGLIQAVRWVFDN